MKKKLLCGVLILTFFWCAPFSRIELASGDTSPPSGTERAEESADTESEDTTDNTTKMVSLPEAAPAPPVREVRILYPDMGAVQPSSLCW